ncbi:MAG: hypothetical protein ABI661_02175 [Gammaproteobacteria bacterium]
MQKAFTELALGLVFLYYFVGGIAHFTRTEMFVRIGPAYISFPLAADYVNGVFGLLWVIGL